ncbi:MAG: chloramphenicol acetyltransferase [Cyanobacteria bacterium RYN_339]|nr:chloramphenicol acetyltransferase [Cyanobacteria bacterium RYN_339]
MASVPYTDLDLATWPRRDHMRLFQRLANPYFSVTVDLDITAWLAANRAAGRPFFPALVHRMTAVANGIEAFRTRIRGERVVLHDRIDPSFTVPWRGDMFNFCTVDFEPDVDAFLARCLPAIAASESADGLILDPAVPDDKLYLSCLPCFPFSSMTHAVGTGDTIPRLAWGRATEREGRTWLAVNFQLHHGLLDGVHVARFLESFGMGALQ